MAKQTVWGFAGNRDLDELKDSNDYILKKIMRARSKKDTRILRRILFGVIFAMVFSFGFLILVSNILAQAWYTAFFFCVVFLCAFLWIFCLFWVNYCVCSHD